MKTISKVFLTGLATVFPVVATFYILFWLATTAESVLGRLIRLFVPEHIYRPGLGVAAGLVVILVVGILMNVWVVRKLFDWSEGLLFRVPVIKSVYGAISDFLHFFSPREKREKDLRQVVLVPAGDSGGSLLGFVTRRDFGHLPPGIADSETVAVYLPMSYQVGGYTVMLPRSAVRPVDMSVEQAMRFVLTAGITANKSRHPRSSPPR
jgi:uncharacterized membrane protein